jgi:septal ring factor EnvC (AmiA/AmiB activator)
MSDVEVALSALAQRVSELECNSNSAAGPGNGTKSASDEASAADVRQLRSELGNAETELDSKMIAIAKLETENAKLRYQIKHLKRSLTNATRYVDPTSFLLVSRSRSRICSRLIAFTPLLAYFKVLTVVLAHVLVCPLEHRKCEPSDGV